MVRRHSSDLQTWAQCGAPESYIFQRSASFRHPNRIYNVVPGDYTHDGTLDVLVMSQSSTTNQLALSLYPAKPGGGFSMCSLHLFS